MFSWVHKTNLQNIIKYRLSPCLHLHRICFVFFSHVLFVKTTSVFTWGAEMLYTATKTTKMISDNHGLDVAWIRSVVFSIHETLPFWHCSFMSSLSDNRWLHLSDPLIMTFKRLGNLTVYSRSQKEKVKRKIRWYWCKLTTSDQFFSTKAHHP